MKGSPDTTLEPTVPIERGEAFTRLLVANQPRVYGFIYALVGDRAAADDVLQEVSTVLWRKFDDFEPGTNFSAWALKIARFSVLEYRRKQSRAPLPLDDATLETLADQAAETAESEIGPMREALHLCLAKLPERQRDLLRARYFDEESVQSIATRRQRTRMAIYKMLRKPTTPCSAALKPMADPHDIENLIAAVRDGDGDEANAQRLADALRDQPEARHRYLRQMYLGSLLREAVGEERAQPKTTRRWWRIAPPAIGAAAALLVALLILRPSSDVSLTAVLESTNGSVFVDGKSASEGDPIAPGQSLAVMGESSSVAVVYADGTRVLVTGQTELQLAESAHKHLVVKSGVLHADVAKQPAGHPMEIVTPDARLEILGTRFVVDASEKTTGLNVTEGRVRMTQSGGESVDVSAGERARFSPRSGLVLTQLPDPPDSWRRDLESADETWGWGVLVTEGLPAGSRRGLGMARGPLVEGGPIYYRLGFRDNVDGLCQITADTHLQLVFRCDDPDWFNLFIETIGPDESGELQIRRYKPPKGSTKRSKGARNEWHSLTIPLGAFTQRTRPSNYGGPPPVPGHILSTVYLSNPEPGRRVQIDAIGFTPSGPGEQTLTTLER